jgi:acyl-coenzyme A thioesterase PaaI-like protein
VLRRLRLEVEPVGESGARLTFPVWDGLLHPLGGVRTGVVVTAIDVAGGMLAARAAHPDWIATAGLSVDQSRPVATGRAEVTVEVLRAGRTAVVLSHEVADGDGWVGAGTMTFTRLHRREGNPEVPAGLPPGKAVFASDGPLPEPLTEAVGLRVDPATATAELDLTDTVRNSLGSVQGGMLGLVAEAAAEAAGSAALGSPARVLDLALDYVAVARIGPVRAVAEVVRVDGPAARVRVRVDDIGADRLAVIAHAGVVTTA